MEYWLKGLCLYNQHQPEKSTAKNETRSLVNPVNPAPLENLQVRPKNLETALTRKPNCYSLSLSLSLYLCMYKSLSNPSSTSSHNLSNPLSLELWPSTRLDEIAPLLLSDSQPWRISMMSFSQSQEIILHSKRSQRRHGFPEDFSTLGFTRLEAPAFVEIRQKLELQYIMPIGS